MDVGTICLDVILYDINWIIIMSKVNQNYKFQQIQISFKLFLGFVLWVSLDPLSNNCISYILIYAMCNGNTKLLSI